MEFYNEELEKTIICNCGGVYKVKSITNHLVSKYHFDYYKNLIKDLRRCKKCRKIFIHDINIYCDSCSCILNDRHLIKLFLYSSTNIGVNFL